MEAFDEQCGWCVVERPVGHGTRDAGRGYFEVNEFSFIQSRIGSHWMGFQQASRLSSFDFCFKGDLSAVQCASYSLKGYLLFSLIWFI